MHTANSWLVALHVLEKICVLDEQTVPQAVALTVTSMKVHFRWTSRTHWLHA